MFKKLQVKYHQNDINDERMNSFLVPQSSSEYDHCNVIVFLSLCLLFYLLLNFVCDHECFLVLCY